MPLISVIATPSGCRHLPGSFNQVSAEICNAPIRIDLIHIVGTLLSSISVEEMEEASLSALETASISAMSIMSGVTQPAPVQTGQTSLCSYCSELRACMIDAHLKSRRVSVLKQKMPGVF